jgi:hypothetical protein
VNEFLPTHGLQNIPLVDSMRKKPKNKKVVFDSIGKANFTLLQLTE